MLPLTTSHWSGTDGRAGWWAGVLRGKDGALAGSPTVDSVSGGGGGWLSDMEAMGSSEG